MGGYLYFFSEGKGLLERGLNRGGISRAFTVIDSLAVHKRVWIERYLKPCGHVQKSEEFSNVHNSVVFLTPFILMF